MNDSGSRPPAGHGPAHRRGQAGASGESFLRAAIVERCREMNRDGLNQGSSGNISVRFGADMLITPSAVAYEVLRPGMVARMSLVDEAGAWSGPCAPSSEWRLHRAILRARADVQAIVHCHAVYATALSMLRQPLPAAHYMVALFGGADVRCAPYRPFGSQALSDVVVAGLTDRTAVLLANHGLVAVGADLAAAMSCASELETLARMYLIARSAGEPSLLSNAEVGDAIARFANYGQARASDSGAPHRST